MAFSLGWKRQQFDPRDVYFLPRTASGTQPSACSLESGMAPNLDQQDLGSCGPNTADECLTFDETAQSLPVTFASRLFIYYTTRVLMGSVGQDSGVDNRTMLKALAQYGFPAESLWPYDTSRFTVKPPANVYAAALPNRIVNYAAVIQNISQMKGCILAGRPFIFGFDVFQQIMSDQAAQTGVLTDPPPGAMPIGGHDVTIFAYDDNGFGLGRGPMFKFRNHWTNGDGTPWGDKGNGYISYSYATGSHASDFWVINSIPGSPVPPPTPPPPPLPPPPPATYSIPQAIPAGVYQRVS
jgi:C1A family cysteine protease